MSNFNEVTPLCYWVQKVLPLVYDDSLSYYELLNRVVKKLNDLIKNNAALPDFIKELIEQYITSGDIEEVITTAISNFILNVKYPPSGITPAVGDGTADDTNAIQGCIDYAFNHGGKAIYFPSGAYLTQSLTLKNNVSLFGFDSTSTRIVLKGGAINPLLTGNVENCTISNLKFDANMDIQVNNIDLLSLSAKNLNLNNLILADGYNLLYINAAGDIVSNNIIFENAVRDCLNINGYGIVKFNGTVFKKLSTLNGRYIINNAVNNAVFTDIFSDAVTDVAINNVGNNCIFVGKINNSNIIINDTGEYTYTNFYNNGGTLQTNINTEKTERETADIILQNNIDAEKTERETADIILQNNIDAEKTERESTDIILQNNIDAEKTERESTDIILQNNIDAEKTERESTDIILQNNIDAEKTERESTDSVLQNQINNNKLFYNVKAFGAKGDGVTNDTEAIISAIGTGNRTIYFPTGVYIITPIEITAKNLHLIGDGWFSSQIRLSSDGNAFTFKSGSSCYVEKLTFNPSTTSSTGITAENDTSLRIYDCLFYNNTNYGFNAMGSTPGISGHIIQNCYFTSNTGIAHINATYWNDFIISNCEFGRIEKTYYNMNYLIILQNSSNGSIYGCSFWEGNKGIYWYNCMYNRFVNNRVESCNEYGFELEICSYCIVTNNWFNDNSTKTNNGFNHLNLKGGTSLTVSNNCFSDWNTENHVKYCISISNECVDCAISNNNGDKYATAFISVENDTAALNNNYDGGYSITTPEAKSNGIFYMGCSVSDNENGSVIIAPFDMTITVTQIDVSLPPTATFDYKYEFMINGVSQIAWSVGAGSFRQYYTDEISINKGEKFYIKTTLINVTTPCYHTIAINYVKR